MKTQITCLKYKMKEYEKDTEFSGPEILDQKIK